MNDKLTMAIRIIFGLFCLIFGINKFFPFIPIPPPTGDMKTLIGVLSSSGFMSVIGVLQIIGGICLLIKKYVPLTLIILIAVFVNATLFHLLLDPENVMGALFGLIMGLTLVYATKPRFLSILSP